MKKRNNKIIILITILVLFIVTLLIFVLNYSKDEASFTILEKKWLSDNKNKVVDVSVFNDVYVFGNSGDGVIFDYLDSFTEEHGISFNKVSYMTNSDSVSYKDLAFKIVAADKKLSANDILLYEDYYTILSLDKSRVNKIGDLSDSSIGLFSSDISLASYYLSEANNLSYKSYSNIDDMINSLKGEEVKYLFLPFNQFLKDVLEEDLNVVYHLKDVSKKYVLNVKDNNTLFKILEKYTLNYMDEMYFESYKSNFVDAFFNGKDISEEEKMGYNANSYVYGYVTNVPFEVKEDDYFGGILSNYLSSFELLFDVDFKTIRYDSVNELKSAFSSGEVDFVFGNFNSNSVNVDRIFTNSLFEEEYVVLSKDTSYLSSIRSLKDKDVYTVLDTYLFDYLNRNGIKTKGYNNTDELIRNIEDNWIVVVDLDTYNYYKNKKLSIYNVIYQDAISDQYSFVIRDVNKNNTFAELFSFYTMTVNYNDFRYEYNINESYLTNNLSNILKYIIICIVLFFVIFSIILLVKKFKNKEKVIKKEEKLKFIDVMTSLKNRNYLNYNIAKWDENVIYPQSFVVIDLNNIKYVNDNHGHEEGDNVIKKAASILIVNQLENTDIIRTDGNEFLVYLVGYSEKDIIAYTRKIYKELKELPYGFGASVGYSMITDDIKTVDDAINEATLEMRKAKEKIN